MGYSPWGRKEPDTTKAAEHKREPETHREEMARDHRGREQSEICISQRTPRVAVVPEGRGAARKDAPLQVSERIYPES